MFHFLSKNSMGESQVNAVECGADRMGAQEFTSLLLSPKQKALASLWTSGPWGGKRGKARNKNVLEFEKKYLRFQIQRPLSGGTWARNACYGWV